MIKIIDCGSQLTQNIARRVRELGVYAEIVPFNTPIERIRTQDLEGIVISGGQFSVYDGGSPIYSKEVLNSGVPIKFLLITTSIFALSKLLSKT